MNRLRDLLHSARFLLIVVPVVGVSVAVAVGCSQVTDGEASDDSNAAVSHHGYGGYGNYGGSSGYDDGNYGNYGYYGDDDDCGNYGYGYYGCHH